MSASDAKWEEQKIKRQQQRKNGHSKYLVCGHMRKERKKEAVLSKMHWALTPSTRSIPIDCIAYTHTHTYSSYGFYGLDIMCAPNVLIYALFSIIYEHKSPKKCSSSHCNNRGSLIISIGSHKPKCNLNIIYRDLFGVLKLYAFHCPLHHI